MNPKDYIKNVLVTESRNFDLLKERISAERSIRLLHGAIGLCTESAELFEMLEKESVDLVNLKEELSDQFWYAAIIIDELALDTGILTSDPELSEAVKLNYVFTMNKPENILAKKQLLNAYIDKTVKHVGLLQDLLKKNIFYGKQLSTEKIQEQLVFICKNLGALCLIGGVTVEDCMISNINKLRLRYGDKFSEQAAIERNLEKERKGLEEK